MFAELGLSGVSNGWSTSVMLVRLLQTILPMVLPLTVDAEIAQQQADIQSARSQVASLRKTLPIVAKLADDYQHLLDKH
ncbi:MULTISPECIES: hypothetical protein [Pseudomonas]|jgi:hypothetical protein|uniref:hypothetical protein n=1 Tax=Pseudomonas TaxID=286 RepID=UPI0013CEB747|nr:hypothetical protein [Pseudomonas sp. FP830]WLI48158.1 hypothetical protein PSH84_16790 [Pseudomonas sp. FP830]